MPEHDDTAELLDRWRESDRRSRDRRNRPPPRRRSKLGALICAAAVVAAGAWVRAEEPLSTSGQPPVRAGLAAPSPVIEGVGARGGEPAVPTRAAMRRAWRFARRRGGVVSIAVVDTRGRIRGRAMRRRYPCASVVKAMLLAAELRRLDRDRLELDGGTLELLRAMITRSDNDSADVVYAHVDDAGLREVAKAAGLRDFTVARSWGYAKITAADMARLFARLRKVVPAGHRRTALRLLRSLTPEHRWGLVRAAGRRWTVYAKGGWRETGSGRLVHQVALLRDGRRTISIAVLTDAQPSHLYGVHTVRGVADRLL